MVLDEIQPSATCFFPMNAVFKKFFLVDIYSSSFLQNCLVFVLVLPCKWNQLVNVYTIILCQDSDSNL